MKNKKYFIKFVYYLFNHESFRKKERKNKTSFFTDNKGKSFTMLRTEDFLSLSKKSFDPEGELTDHELEEIDRRSEQLHKDIADGKRFKTIQEVLDEL